MHELAVQVDGLARVEDVQPLDVLQHPVDGELLAQVHVGVGHGHQRAGCH